MSNMKGLIKGQTIIIDDHRRGQVLANFDDPAADIHLDKKSNDGQYRIRVPLNSNRPVIVERKGKRNLDIVPQGISREVQDAFEDAAKRDEFVRWMISELRNFPYKDQNRENDRNRDINKAFGALRRVSKHFGLRWSNRNVRCFIKPYRTFGLRCMATITDGPNLYYLSVDRLHFVISDYFMIGLHDRRFWEELPFIEE